MIRFSLFLSVLVISSISTAAPWQEKASKVVTKVLAEVGTSKDNFGIWIKNKNQVASHNGDKMFVPASLSKIPTALTFFSEKSMDDYFHTWIYKTGEIENGVLNGDLYLKGGGDPSFVNESMWMMINELKRSDIKQIKGQLYVDESYFDSDYYSNGRQTRRVDRAYDAPVSALSFNWNSLSIYVRPGKKAGSAARVYVYPEVPFIEIVNKATTTNRSKNKLKVERSLQGQKIIIKVSGKISIQTDEKAFYKSVGDAALWTGYNFKEFLNKAGVEYKGAVTKKIVPPGADQLVEYDSWNMARILSALSKFSNNFVAEMLTKHLGKEESRPAGIKAGLQKIIQFLNKKGWKKSEYKFVNPSGFTRENKMKASFLGNLLSDSLHDFKLAPEFMSSLPISGTDGTLKKRMRQVMREKVRAKTGYLSGVVGLAGYLKPKSGGEPITFVFFYNGPYKYDWEVRALFDKLLWRLYQNS